MDSGALAVKTFETYCVFAPCESLDGPPRLREIGVQIQYATVAPGVSGNDRTREQGEVVLEVGPRVSEQLLKNRAHRQYGGPAIDCPVIDLPRMHFAPRSSSAFQHSYPEAGFG